MAAPGLELVAVDGTGAVVGIMDTAVDTDLATIDTVAVHPDQALHRTGLLAHRADESRQQPRGVVSDDNGSDDVTGVPGVPRTRVPRTRVPRPRVPRRCALGRWVLWRWVR